MIDLEKCWANKPPLGNAEPIQGQVILCHGPMVDSISIGLSPTKNRLTNEFFLDSDKIYDENQFKRDRT